MQTLGQDKSGVTEISLEALQQACHDGEELDMINIKAPDSMNTVCKFTFRSNKMYIASGFSIGYGGEGPRGLWKAIKLFHPDKAGSTFQESGIGNLHYGNWKWTIKGFVLKQSKG